MPNLRAGRALLLLLLLALWPAPARPQSLFGKNKVHYDPLEWRVLETPHVRLHYYAEEETLARQAAALAESVCVEFDRRFRLKSPPRIPLLLYSSHHLFQQTNATPSLISEGTGGLTELIKGRVLIPYTGSWRRLVWVTRHELAHAYMLAKITRVMRDHRRSQGFLPPLWFIEGLAEYCGTTWDAEAEGLMRDAVVSGRARPVTRSDAIEGTVLMYKEGQSFLLKIAEDYGSEKVFDLLDNWYRADDFETVVRITLGETLKDLDERWFESLRRRYYPTVATRQTAPEAAARVTRRGRFNLGCRALPARGPADTALRVVYFAANDGATDLVLSEPRGGRRAERRLLRGGLSQRFESFHLFQNRPDVSASGALAMVSKRGGRDVLYVLDERGRVRRTMDFPSLVAIHSPALAPGDSAVIFGAQDRSGQCDLYQARWNGGRPTLERLTRDPFDDLDPEVSPDGGWVWFASDRSDADGHYSLHRLSLETGAIERMSDPGAGDDRQPAFSPDGRWVLYRSTRDSSSDLYVRPAGGPPESRRLTRLIGPAMDPDWAGPHRVIFTGENAVEFQVYWLAVDPDTLPAVPESIRPAETPPPPVADGAAPKSYERRIGLDLVQNGILIDPGLGVGGGGQIALSDVLGNEQIYIFLSNDSDRFGDFWDGFEGGLTYVNQSQRLNYGVGLFRLTQLYDQDLDLIRREKRVGTLLLASYPFSKFTRLDANLVLRHASSHRLQNGDFRDVDLVSNFLAWIYDDTRWTQLGPSGGWRMALAGGYTRDLTSGAGDYGTLFGEVRHYRQPLQFLTAATRVQAQVSLGRDRQRFYLGGPYALPGYPRRTLAGTRTLLAAQELRFPVLRGLVLGVPVAWETPTVSGALLGYLGWGDEEGAVTRLGGTGFGLYLGGGYYPALRWNWVWRTRDLRTFERRPVMQFVFAFNY